MATFVLYAKGHTKSCATVSDAAFNFTRVMFAEFDKSGSLYIDGLNGGYQTALGLVTGGCNATSITNLAYVYTIGFPGGIQIDGAGRIAYADPYQQQVDTSTRASHSTPAKKASDISELRSRSVLAGVHVRNARRPFAFASKRVGGFPRGWPYATPQIMS